ncbi:MAG: small multi-drug export protein [candidate division WOR-3 bacterium]
MSMVQGLKSGSELKTGCRRLFGILLLVAVPALVYAGSGERVAEWLGARGLSPQLVVLLVSMLPIVELRGAVPIGNNLFGLPLWQTLLLAIGGNMLPIFLVVLLLEKAVEWLGHIAVFRRFFDWLFQRTRKRSGVIERFEFWGLVIFVGIPLPMTGAWTGSVAAVLLGMPYFRALLGIFLGVLMAAVIVTALSLLKWWGVAIAVVLISIITLQQFLSARRRSEKFRTGDQ